VLKAYLNNFLWLFLTYLSAPYLYFQIFLRRRKKNHQLKILIISTAKIGDMVCTTPVFREIKKKFPDCHLTALITNKTKDIVVNNPRLDEIILIDDYSRPGLIKKLRKEKYDWAFNVLLGSFNTIIAFWSLIPNRVSTLHRGAGEMFKFLAVFNNYRLEYQSHTRLVKHYLNLLKFIGITDGSENEEIFWSQKEENKMLDFLKSFNLSLNDLLIGISVTTGVGFKNWKNDKFVAISDKLIKELGAKIIFVGGPNDSSAIKQVQDLMQNTSLNSAGCFTLAELPALLKKMKLFISLDTGPLYIANAVGTPVIDIGGCLDFREQAPTGPRSRILPKTNSSRYSFVDSIDSVRKAWLDRQLQEITPEEIFETARELLDLPKTR